MKICLLGYGKMGKAIEDLAPEYGILISGRIGSKNQDEMVSAIQACDVVIDFSLPVLAIEHMKTCIELNKPVVCGTTGWQNEIQEIKTFCEQHNGSILYSSNFSIGVNLFFTLNKKLASLMKSYNEYTPQLKEIHHLAKIDSPSGTAISLASDILAITNKYNKWKLGFTDQDGNLGIESFREAQVPGTHEIKYTSPVDSITIIHEAKSRKGFAAGSIVAAKWLKDKKGFFTMDDLLSQ